MTSLINKFSKITINVTIFSIPKTPSLTFSEVDSIILIPILLEFGIFFLMKFSVDYRMICYHFETVWLICEIKKLQNGNKPNTSSSLLLTVNCHVKCHDAILSTSMHDAENKTYTHATYKSCNTVICDFMTDILCM